MEFFGVIILIVLGYAFLSGYLKGRRSTTTHRSPSNPRENEPPSDEKSEDELIYQRVIRDFSSFRDRHGSALRLLQLVSYIDGTSTKAEKGVITYFLTQQGETLLPLHLDRLELLIDPPGLIDIELKQVDRLLSEIKLKPNSYKNDVVAAAIAIVAGGGTPKKREAELLETIRSALAT